MNPRAFFIVLLLASPARAESFRAWAARGAREEREKDDATALKSYSNALSSWKDSDGAAGKAKVLCARAALRDRGGDEAGALEDYSGCVALDKKNAKAFDRRGELRLKSGKTSPAIDDFYKAISLDIRYAAAYADRAKAYELQGDRGFAAEDYRRACEFGAAAACPKAKELAPARKAGAQKKKAAPAPQEKAAAAPAPEPETAEPPADKAEAAPAPAAKAAKRRAPRAAYTPRVTDCLDSLQTCADDGNAFGSCVARAPACARKAVKGCCPGACLDSYRRALNRGSSEAAAYRDIFTPKASCSKPPKSND